MEEYLKEPLRQQLWESFFPVTNLADLKEKISALGYEISAEKKEKGIVSFYGFKPRTFVKYIMFFYVEKDNKLSVFANLSPEPKEILLLYVSNLEDENFDRLERMVSSVDYSAIAYTLKHEDVIFTSSLNPTRETKRFDCVHSEMSELDYRSKILFPYAIFENRIAGATTKEYGTLLMVSLHKYFLSNYGELKSIATISQKKRENMAENIMIDYFKRNFFLKMISYRYDRNGNRHIENIDFDLKKDKSFLIEVFVARYVQKEFLGKYKYSSEELFSFFNSFVKDKFWYILKKIAQEYPNNEAKVLRGENIRNYLAVYDNQAHKAVYNQESDENFRLFLSKVINLCNSKIDEEEFNPFLSIEEHEAGITEIQRLRVVNNRDPLNLLEDEDEEIPF